MKLHAESISVLVHEMSQSLQDVLTISTDRKRFISVLSEMLYKHVPFDRLCINLYDQEGGILMYFTAAQGKIISTLSPVRPAETTTTVAGQVIATRKPVIITDFSQHFTENSIHPIAEAGLTATMAFPLILNNEIIATLHCSFAKVTKYFYTYTSFLLALSPVVATCLGAILSLEQFNVRSSLSWQPLHPVQNDDHIICHSPVMRDVMRTVDVVSKLGMPVLLLGETGTGKSLLAKAIHRRSQRKDANFVKVNCPSLPQTLFESELFGHAKGSFTGAVSKRMGRFELAHGGSLFLDEIGELSLEVQSKLLQALEDSSFERVGESLSIAVDVRIIAATNVHLGNALNIGRLRPDLLYRLSSCTIELPPLRMRKEDIPLLVTSLSSQMVNAMNLSKITFKNDLIEPLLHYSWPGNVRELRNVISRLLMLHSIGKTLSSDSVLQILEENQRIRMPIKVQSHCEEHCSMATVEPMEKHTGVKIKYHDNPESLAAIETKHILSVLRFTGGTLSGPRGAAALLGIPRGTLQHRMKKLGIDKKDWLNM